MRSNEQPRYMELRKMRKAELCALYRNLGHVWSLRPLEKWTKEEVISSILEVEFRHEREAERVKALETQDYTQAVYHHTLDVTKPYGYRVDRADGEEEWTFSTGYSDGAERPGSTEVAQAQAYETRIGHSYYGPLRVYVWQQRDQEHCRLPVPDNADLFDFPAHPQLEEHRAKEKQD